jgi:hypothetical protein
LFRELRTLLLPATHVPVGYCRQNGRCRRCLATRHSNNDDLVLHILNVTEASLSEKQNDPRVALAATAVIY